MRNILLALAAATLLASCASTPEDTQPGAGVEDRAKKPAITDTSPVKPQSITGDALGDPSKDPRLKDPRHILSKRSVFFDYDSDIIKPEFVPVVEAHAQFLREYKNAKMLIQGNADDRGSREYNIGLGQRRSDALKKRLVLLGATEIQVESVSLGEEKPMCSEGNEGCWAQNRRGDILYGGEF
jgi:peptidoglycan-associated lipoprotein